MYFLSLELCHIKNFKFLVGEETIIRGVRPQRKPKPKVDPRSRYKKLLKKWKTIKFVEICRDQISANSKLKLKCEL